MSNQIIYDHPSPGRFVGITQNSQKMIKNSNVNKISQLFSLPNFQSNRLYQTNIQQIIQSLSQLNILSENLQNKIDKILIAHKNQFVESYKQHMKKIQFQFKLMEEEIWKQKQLIKHYENQGKMSNLMKKVSMLEEEAKKLYEIIQKKQKQIKGLQLEIKVQKQENKRLAEQMKSLLKYKNETTSQLSSIQGKQKTLVSSLSRYAESGMGNNHNQYEEQLKSFTTEMSQKEDIVRRKSSNVYKGPRKNEGVTYNRSQLSKIEPFHSEHSNTNKRLTNLIIQNRQLTKFNCKILQQRSQLQNFFIKSINQINKQIMDRKKIRFCSFQDFKKQDKINLLLTVISNQQLLHCLYQKIFGNQHVNQLIQRKDSSSLMQNNAENFTNTLVNHQKKRTKTSLLPYL